MPYIGQEAATTYSTRLAVQQFNGDGSTTAFTLNQSVSADQDILVSVDGVVQDTSAYTVSNGTTLTFSPAPSSGTANIFVNYLGLAVGTVTHPATQGLTATTGAFSSTLAVTGVSTLTGKVGIGTSSPAINLCIGDGSITDNNSKVQINAATGEESYFAANKGGGYGALIGYTNNEGAGQGVGLLLRVIPADPIIFKNNDTERMRIDGSGAVTMPAQPAFLATPASQQNNFSKDTAVTVVLGTEIFDLNSDFASNVFTAPVTGKYQFNLSVQIFNWDVAATYYQARILTSNREYNNLWDAALHASTDHDYITLTISALADMDASDTASAVVIQQDGTDAQSDIGVNSRFSGYLAC